MAGNGTATPKNGTPNKMSRSSGASKTPKTNNQPTGKAAFKSNQPK